MSEYVYLRLDGDGIRGVAGVHGPRMRAEIDIMHYAAVYAQGGPVKVWEGRKRRRDLEPPPPPGPTQSERT